MCEVGRRKRDLCLRGEVDGEVHAHTHTHTHSKHMQRGVEGGHQQTERGVQKHTNTCTRGKWKRSGAHKHAHTHTHTNTERLAQPKHAHTTGGGAQKHTHANTHTGALTPHIVAHTNVVF